MAPYAAHRWPAWSVPPGTLTPHGALLLTAFGTYYRALYARAGLFEPAGCPSADRIAVWADATPLAAASADALLAGLAPDCGLAHRGVAADAGVDPIFAPIPILGKADPALAADALSGAIGAKPSDVLSAYRLPYGRLDAILDCATADCRHIASLPASIAIDPTTDLASLRGPVDTAAAAVEELQLEYVEGLPSRDVGWGHLDLQTLQDLSQLRVLRQALENRNPYAARVTASNLAAHLLATLNQNVTGKSNALSPVPLQSRFVAFLGTDANVAGIGGLLRLSWLISGDAPNDVPPGSALVFELYDADAAQSTPFVQSYFVAQPLGAMRRATDASSVVSVRRVPVYVPGCPSLNCPIGTFNAIVQAAVDTGFVSGR